MNTIVLVLFGFIVVYVMVIIALVFADDFSVRMGSRLGVLCHIQRLQQ